jgi:2-methylcitrate dehydratase PrpD
VVVTALTGRFEREVAHVPGDPERPFDEAALARKFHRLVVPVLGERETNDALALSLTALERADGAAALLRRIERIYDGTLTAQR